MARISEVPFEELGERMRERMREYDEELGGSGFVQVLAQAPEVFESFLSYYFPLVSETRGKIDMRLTEMARLKVADHNDCHL